MKSGVGRGNMPRKDPGIEGLRGLAIKNKARLWLLRVTTRVLPGERQEDVDQAKKDLLADLKIIQDSPLTN